MSRPRHYSAEDCERDEVKAKEQETMSQTPIESPKDYFELTGECPTCHTTVQQYEAYREMVLALKRAYALEKANHGMTSHAYAYQHALALAAQQP